MDKTAPFQTFDDRSDAATCAPRLTALRAELAKLGHPIAASTVWQILRDAGIDSVPRRAGSAWKQFLTTQAAAFWRPALSTWTPCCCGASTP